MLKKIITTCFLSLPILLGGCGEEKSTSTSSGEEKKLVMVTSADWPPFEYFLTSNGHSEIVGLDIDIAKRIGQYLGYEIEVKDMDFASIIPTLQSHRADFAMAGITPTKEREKSISFSEPYYYTNTVMVYQPGNDPLNRTDYKGVTITVQLGSAPEQYAKVWAEAHPGSEVVSLNRIGDVIQEVLAGRANGAIMEQTTAQSYVEKYNGKLALKNLQGKSFGYAIAFAKDSPLIPEFNRALNHLRDNGELDKILQKWLVKS